MTITIYHSPFARSVRVIWLCEEMELPYTIEEVENNRAFLSTPEYRAINPMGRIPAMRDGDVLMAESMAIMEYLMAKHETDLDRKPDHPDFPAYLQWFHFGEATLAPYVTMALGHNRLLPEDHRIPAMGKWGEREAQHCFEVMNGPLSTHDYLLPSGFSAVDISVAYVLILAKFASVFDGAPAPVKAYFERICARPGWKKATGTA
ncbi:MAG: glutathione S-transferase [Pseudomonadota bacterium]